MKQTIFLFFLLTLSLTSIAQSSKTCEDYSKGFFQYKGKHMNTVIYRKKNYQIEYNTRTGNWITIELNWISPCHYSFVYLNTSISGMQEYIGSSMSVNIVSGDSGGYSYLSRNNFSENKEYTGQIIRVNDLTKSDQRKIKKKLRTTKRKAG